MRGWLAVLALILFAAPVGAKQPLGQSGRFVPAGELSAPRSGHTATLLADGRVVIVGGVGADGTPTDLVEIYDPANGSVSRAGAMLEGRNGHSAVLLADGRVFIAGGQSAGTEIFDSASGTFTAGPQLSVAQINPALVRLADGRVLVAGGLHARTTAPAEVYDPDTNAFTRASPYASSNMMLADTIGPVWPTATLLGDGRVLLVGNGIAESFDPVTDSFQLAAPMASAQFRFGMVFHTATELADGSVLVTGGTDEMVRMVAADRFDPASGMFVEVGSLPSPRCNHTATRLADGSVLVIGGDSEAPMGGRGWSYAGSASSTVRFDPASNAFASGPDMLARRSLHTATLLADGSVLVVGGMQQGAYVPRTPNPIELLRSMERFVPSDLCAKRWPGRCGAAR